MPTAIERLKQKRGHMSENVRVRLDLDHKVEWVVHESKKASVLGQISDCVGNAKRECWQHRELS